MGDFNLANQLIPNYETLPKHVRTAFEQTDAGKELAKTTEQLHKALNPDWLTQLFALPFLTDESPEDEINAARTLFRRKMRYSKEHHDLVRKSHLLPVLQKKLLKHYFARFNRALEQLQAICQTHTPVLNLSQFNANFAKTLDAKKSISINEWLKQYESSLCDHITNNIGLIDGKKPFPAPALLSKEGARDSLSKWYAYTCSIINNQKEVKKCVDLLYQMSDAHAFLQGTGFATQNETSRLATFDIINYFRMAGNINEAKGILSKFIQPFTPLYLEYLKINKEYNVALQVLRTVMPMLILSATVILVAALLSHIVIPEIAFFFILIPTIYLGLAAASGYVVLKDQIYNDVLQWWFGGQFNTPYYQVNKEMITSFDGNLTDATIVRDFYVEEIEACIEKEKSYQKHPKLSQEDKDGRRANADRSIALELEWYDIHSNPKLSTNEVRATILNRLNLDGRQACEAIQKELSNESKGGIPKFVNELVKEHHGRRHGNTFFEPACFKHRREIVRLDMLKEDITGVSTGKQELDKLRGPEPEYSRRMDI